MRRAADQGAIPVTWPMPSGGWSPRTCSRSDASPAAARPTGPGYLRPGRFAFPSLLRPPGRVCAGAFPGRL